MYSKHPVRFHFLGPFAARTETDHPKLSRKTAALVAYLATTGVPHSRDGLAARFCSEARDPAGSLRWHLSRIRRQLAPELLVSEQGTVRFDRQSVWIDVLHLERCLKEGTQLGEAVDLYRGEFLEGMHLSEAPEFELWLMGERSRVRHIYEQALERFVDQLVEKEDYDEAIRRCRQLLQSDPLLEAVHGRLIWLYSTTGRKEDALRQFDLCEQVLQQELAVKPSPELVALKTRLESGAVTGLHATRPRGHGLSVPAVDEQTSLIERTEALNGLEQALQLASQKHGQLVLVAAEAGGGKTSLVEQFSRTRPDTVLLAGRCYESTRSISFHPWVELLERCLSWMGDAGLDRLSPYWLDQLARLVPSVAAKREQTPANVAHHQEHLFAAVAELLFVHAAAPAREPGAQMGLVLFIDDLQWADDSSLHLFHYVARRLERQALCPILLVGAYRPEEVGDSPALATVLDDLQRSRALHTLTLPPLSAGAVDVLIARQWPDLPAGYRTPHVRDILLAQTDGNPLFLTELLQVLAAPGEHPYREGVRLPETMPIPPSLRILIERRLRQLPESGQQVIEALAVLGNPTTPAQVRLVSGRSESECEQAIDLGLRWRFLQTDTVRQERTPTGHSVGDELLIDFRHDLIREGVLAQVGELRRRRLHRRAMGMFIEAPEGRFGAATSERTARIVYHAVRADDPRTVLIWAPQAAARAKELLAFTDALAFYEQALASLRRLRSGLVEEEWRRQLMQFLLSRCETLEHLGRWSQMETDLREVEEMIEPTNLEGLARFHLQQARYFLGIGEYEASLDEIKQAYSRYLQAEQPAGVVDSLVDAGNCHLTLGRCQDAHRLYRQALRVQRAAGESKEENVLLTRIAMCLLELGRVEGGITYLARVKERAEVQHDKLSLSRTYLVTAAAWNWYNHGERVKQYAQQALQLGWELDLMAIVNRSLLYLAAGWEKEGDLDQSQDFFQQALARARDLRDGWVEGWATQYLGRIEYLRGDLVTARTWLEKAYRLRVDRNERQNQISDLTWLARLCLAEGRIDQALAHTEQAIRDLADLDGQVYVLETSDVLYCRAEALSAGQQPDDAKVYFRRAHDALMDFADQIADPDVLRIFLAYPPNRHLLSTWRSGQIRSYLPIRRSSG